MPDFKVVRQIAQQTLTTPSLSEKQGSWLWDRTCCILRNVEQISRLPEPARHATAIDRPCLITAAYFAESGHITFSQERNTTGSIPPDISDAELFTASTQIVSKQLSKVLNPTQIHKINKIITESLNRFTQMIEAMILSDARNLEDMGSIGLLHELRRNLIQGKSVSDLLDSWKYKIEYGYWQARIKESFRFDSVRQVAQQRLAAAAVFMDQAAIENSARDLEKYILQTAQKQ